MNIQGIQAYQAMKQGFDARRKKEAGRPRKPLSMPRDTFTSSGEPAESSERAALLEKIRKKINAGFYNRDEVTDDLSHSFAKLFHDTL